MSGRKSRDRDTAATLVQGRMMALRPPVRHATRLQQHCLQLEVDCLHCLILLFNALWAGRIFVHKPYSESMFSTYSARKGVAPWQQKHLTIT